MGYGSKNVWRGTEKAEDAKLPHAGISPKQPKRTNGRDRPRNGFSKNRARDRSRGAKLSEKGRKSCALERPTGGLSHKRETTPGSLRG